MSIRKAEGRRRKEILSLEVRMTLKWISNKLGEWRY
jgi:hypothetical protein